MVGSKVVVASQVNENGESEIGAAQGKSTRRHATHCRRWAPLADPELNAMVLGSGVWELGADLVLVLALRKVEGYVLSTRGCAVNYHGN